MKESRDLWFNAYLLYKGAKMGKFESIGQNKVKCFWIVTDEDWQRYKIEFNTSEQSAFRGYLDKIKGLIF